MKTTKIHRIALLFNPNRMYHTAGAGATRTVTSDDTGKTWQRHNDDKHQHGGISTLAASRIIPRRLFISGAAHGVLFRN